MERSAVPGRPVSVVRKLQQHHPVYEFGGTNVVSRYEDIVRYARRPIMSAEAARATQGPW